VAFELLTKAGVDVVVADGGPEALRMADGEVFDGILMDLQMPEMDGFQTASLILAKPAYKHVPIIAMSAAVMPEDKQKCFAAGMVDHVGKPMVPELLISTLLKWVKPPKRDSAPVLPDAPPPDESDEYAVPLDAPGFDFPGAIRRCGGDNKLLCMLLHSFSDDYSTVIGKLDALTRAGDAKGTLMLLHTMKGAAGTVGAALISDIAGHLEEEVNSGTFPVSLGVLDVAIQETCDFISRSIRKPV
jgi:CheY-like chemotaxis protein